MASARWRRARRAAPASSVRSRQTVFCGGFYKQQSRLFRNCKADAAAIFAASRPTQSRLTVPFPARRYFSATPVVAAAPALRSVHRVLAFHQTHQFIGYAIHNISTFSSAQMMLLSKDAPLTMTELHGRGQRFHPPLPAGCQPCGNQTFIGVFTRRFHYRFAPVTTSRPIPGNLNKRCAVSIPDWPQ